ncbi:MAG TPA: MalY/PatB family protein [Anaerolineales bacterium]|nr:MalY/PatB family protein [Anaerolineales bacterium]
MSMTFNFDHLIDRRGHHSAKWSKVETDELPLWVADMDFQSPPPVIEALEHAVSHGVFGYPNFGKLPEETIVNWLAERHNWQVDPAHIVLLPGVVAGFNMAAAAAAQPGEAVLVQPPTYGPFLRVAKNWGLTQQENALLPDETGRFQVDLDAFEAAITPETRLFILCNPQNPTGRVFTQAELEGMAEICLRHDVLICSDEIHHDLVYRGQEHIPIASLNEEIAANTITLLAPSKTFNIAGLQASAGVIENDELRAKFNAQRKGIVEWVNMMGMVAMQTAYAEGGPWLDDLLPYLEENRNLVVDTVQNKMPGVKMAVPEGTYLAWLDCRGLDMGGYDKNAKLNPFFKEQAGVVLNNGQWFGTGGEGFVRLNFGCPRPVLQEALDRMEKAVGQAG